MNKIILLGAPGAGKGTVSNYLISNYNYGHLSTGDMFREAINNQNDPLGVQIKNIISRGELVPDDLTNKLVSSAIEKIMTEDIPGFILDGYPRTVAQADYLSSVTKIDLVIYLEVDEKVLMERLTGRRLCKKCNSIYNVNTNMKPKVENICDKCGLVLIQRKDDVPETVKSRIEEYKNKTLKLINYYDELGILKKINAVKPLDEIFGELDNLIMKK